MSKKWDFGKSEYTDFSDIHYCKKTLQYVFFRGIWVQNFIEPCVIKLTMADKKDLRLTETVKGSG